MSILARSVLGLAAVLAVAIAGITLVGGRPSGGRPLASPIATPLDTPLATPRQVGSPMPEPSLAQTFTSNVYDYSVRYPGTWRTAAAPHSWSATVTTAADKPTWGNSGLDVLQGTDIRLLVWGQAIPPATGLSQGQAAAAWAGRLAAGASTCQADSQLPATFVISEGAVTTVAYTIVNGCASIGGLLKDGVVYEVAVVPLGHNWTYGWDFTFDGRVDAPYVRAMLESLDLIGPRSF